jgi:hypothetical protein
MFGTNNVKYHLFTLMVFDFHRIRVLVAWVITIKNHVKRWWNGWMPCEQSFSCICQIGNHHVLLWMMPHSNSKDCGRLYIDFLFLLHCFMFWYYISWGFHNIFIVHGNDHGKHIDVGCTMVGLCGVKILSQIFFMHGMCWKHGTYAPWKKSKV